MASGVTNGEITIKADPALIMDVIGDLEKYPEWSDGVNGAEILEANEDGRPKTARLSFASGPIKDEFVLEYDWNGNDSVSWKLTEGSMLKKEDGTYTLTPQADGSVHVRYDLEVEVAIKLPGIIRKQAEKKIVKTALEGLKARVEQLQG